MAAAAPAIERGARFRGALLGLAVCDALGASIVRLAHSSRLGMPLEGARPPVAHPVSDMKAGGKFGLAAGQFTDDTSMALCLAESIILKGGFDPADQMRRYLDWYRNGHMSSNGICFVLEFEKNPSQPFAATTGELARHGNGSLMRLCPAPLSAAQAPLEAMRRAVDSSRTTHGSHLAIDCCRYFTSLLLGCLAGASKAELLSPNYIAPGLPTDYWSANPLAPEVDALAKGAYKSKSPPEIRGAGHVVNTLEAVLWAFYSSEDFATGALKVVNLGEDADTTGAVYGQMAGCFYGEDAIPAAWRSQSALGRFISLMGDEIYRLSQLKEGETFSPSAAFTAVHSIFLAAQTEYAPLHRRLEPGPRMFRSEEEFNADVQAFTKALKERCASQSQEWFAYILEEFTRRLSHHLSQIRPRFARAKPMIGLPPKKDT